MTGSGGRATIGVETYRHDPYAALPGATGTPSLAAVAKLTRTSRLESAVFGLVH